MSGHSKWAQIKRHKASTDAKRSAVFGKFARLISVESKRAGGNIESPSLRAAIDRASAINMPKENIDRAVLRGAEAGGMEMETATYECYGPGGVAVVIDALTDNRNRTAQELKHLLSEYSLSLANPGSALWAFKKNADGAREPVSTVELGGDDLATLEALVDQLEARDDVDTITTNAA